MTQEPGGRDMGSLSRVALVAAGLGAFLFGHDFVGAGVVVPAIQDDFSSGLGSVQWVITGFSIAVALAVVPAGRLADVFGAGRTFAAGALAFAAASALIAIAPELWILLAARALAGLAGGFVWISAVTLIFTHFGPSRAGTATGVMMILAGLGSAMGPIDAGLLIEWAGWRAVYAFNVPLALFAGLVMLRQRTYVPPEANRSIDWTGIGILAGALVALLVTLRYAPQWGWGDARTILGFLLAALLFAVFALQQRAWGARALVPPDIVRNRVFAVTLLGEAVLASGYFVAISFGPQVFANVLGADSIESGLMQAPVALGSSVGGALAGLILSRSSSPMTVPAAAAIGALGTLVLVLMPDAPSYLDLLPGLVLIGLGTGGVFGSMLATGIRVLPEERRGLASGLLYTFQLAGGAIVLASATAVATGSEELLQGAKSAFLFAAVLSVVGIAATALAYGAISRSASTPEATDGNP